MPQAERGPSLRRLRVQIHRLPLREELLGGLALLAGAAGAVFHAAEGDLELEAGALLVDLDDARPNVLGEAQRLREVVGEEARRQAERRVVREPDRLLVRRGGDDGGDGA